MAFSLIPDQVCGSVYDLDPQALAAQGIKLLLADLDNTLADYRTKAPDARLTAWRDGMQKAGITVFLLSNSRKSHRASDFAQAFEIPCIRRAGKPKKKGFLAAMAQMKATPAQTAMVGDQLFTDCLGANNAGVRSILVRPVKLDNPFRAVRYWVELPFRAAGKRREKR